MAVFTDTSAAQSFAGGADSDTVDFQNSANGVVADLAAGSAYKVVRIMPLGDSITHGLIDLSNRENGGYRRLMSEEFAARGVQIDFVGSLSNGPSTFLDRQHEGHSGWTLNQLNSSDAGFLATADPDVVLLIGGTNDSKSDSSTTMRNDLRNLLVSLTDADPDLLVLVGSVPPVRVPEQSQTRANRVDAYNDLMPALVAELAAAGRKVAFVDMRALTVDDVSPGPADNGLHPTAEGYEKIADFWFDGLEQHYGLNSTGIGFDRDAFSSIEDLTGSSFSDTLGGNDAANRLEGMAGADRLQGRKGDDVLIGGAGDDMLDGGAGSDRFLFDVAASTGDDQLSGFDRTDRLVTSAALPQSGGSVSAADGVLLLDGAAEGDTVTFGGTSVSALRFLGQTAEGYLYGDAAARPTGAFEGTTGKDAFAGDAGDARANVFFFDVAPGDPLSRDTITRFGAKDILVVTTKVEDGNNDGVVTFGTDKLLNFFDGGRETGAVGLKSLSGSTITRLEYDGAVSHGGVEYFVYSLVGSSAGTGDLLFS